MSDDKDTWATILEETHAAVRRYASIELDSLARRAIHALQRLPASGIFGGYRFKSVWDEYCHEVQHGPTPTLEWAWDQTIRPMISYPFSRLPAHIALLISVGADYELTQFDDMVVCIQPDVVFEAVKDRLVSKAINRKMDRFYDI